MSKRSRFHRPQLNHVPHTLPRMNEQDKPTSPKLQTTNYKLQTTNSDTPYSALPQRRHVSSLLRKTFDISLSAAYFQPMKATVRASSRKSKVNLRSQMFPLSLAKTYLGRLVEKAGRREPVYIVTGHRRFILQEVPEIEPIPIGRRDMSPRSTPKPKPRRTTAWPRLRSSAHRKTSNRARVFL